MQSTITDCNKPTGGKSVQVTAKVLFGEYDSTHYCTQLAFTLLLMVAAFPHEHQQTQQLYNKSTNDEYKQDDQINNDTYHFDLHKIYLQTDKESFTNLHPFTENLITNISSNASESLFTNKEDFNNYKEIKHNATVGRTLDRAELKEIDDAVEYGLQQMHHLYFVKEPELYKKGLFLHEKHPAYILASFRSPRDRTLHLARYGYAALEARSKLEELRLKNFGRQAPSFESVRSRKLSNECPLQGFPRCPKGFERYRTADGTCNNLQHPWRGASMLPLQRFLPPHYNDGIQTIRKSVLGGALPSARDISTRIHRDKNREVESVTLMFMQWGQFLDHDLTSSAQARMFNRSVPRCCQNNGLGLLPKDLTHPECLPIPVSKTDWFLSQFGIRCIEFVRSAPTSRIDCDLGWREQINQVTSYIDASNVYGSDQDLADSLRVFHKGLLLYGRSRDQRPLQPPDPPKGELCRLGVVTTDCFRGGDSRTGDQPGLTAVHTIWIRYHNKLAKKLALLNSHWSDEKIYQEARRIVVAFMQHITYREFLPILLGNEVVKLFDLGLEQKGYYKEYSAKANPAVANSFSTAAFRFGHSLVQRSFIRTDTKHRLIRNNVTLHEEQKNIENIWSFGSLDRLLLGLINQPIQKRDEFITNELTNHLFQTEGVPFGMDLAAVNIQRGRDHGLPSYTAWRKPCGLIPLKNWTDFEKVMSVDTVARFRSIYAHFDDIDLFSGGLAEKPVRGGLVGPTFACIIAQQFINLRKGDRFWYENGDFESSLTPAQLQQIRRITFAHVLCRTLDEIETIQPFVFLSVDNRHNARVSCNDASVNNFDLNAWVERPQDDVDSFLREAEDYDYSEDDDNAEERKRVKKKKIKHAKRTTTTVRPIFGINSVDTRPVQVKFKNVTATIVHLNHRNKYGQPLTIIRTKPVVAKDQTPTKTSPKRPQFSTKRPLPPNKPSVDGYLFQYPMTTTTTTQPTTKYKPTYQVNVNVQFLPSSDQYPVQLPDKIMGNGYSHDKFHFNVDSSNIYDNKPSYYDGPYVTKRPQTDYYNYNQKPMYHKETVYQEVPFATSSRPYTFDANKYTTSKPVTIPSYLYLTEDDDDDYDNNKPDTDNKPYNPYYSNSPDVIFYPILSQQVQLRPSSSYKNSPLHYNNDDNDKKFIKISSIQGQKFTTAEEMKRPVYISVQQRDGDDLELEEYGDQIVNFSLLQVDITPSEVRLNDWLMYFEDEDIAPASPLFDIVNPNIDANCANELPHPMKLDNFSTPIGVY
ncbi:hypothetical protein RN001_014305 [Aquatica leii]|uniref:Chorion peroxidase n=1 Tax=Aquatica leii TaxID=1421715 RepID=A0AAN7NXB0_9COLE|nr:hypothetical protein RN001_014305 [Aquatica leii]